MIDILKEEIEEKFEYLNDLENQIDTYKDCQAKLIEDHKAELESAREITAEAIAAKAAEQLAEVGHDPVPTEAAESGSNEKVSDEMTREEFWTEYRRLDWLRDFEGKNKFYAENKHILAQ